MFDEQHLARARQLVEAKLGWGNPAAWTTRDFERLADMVGEVTGVQLSAVTLKRIWGRVQYDSAPSGVTLDALAQFLGFSHWRAFCGSAVEAPGTTPPSVAVPHRTKRIGFTVGAIVIVAAVAYLSLAFFSRSTSAPAVYTLSSRTIVSEGLPNSVVFDIDARRAPTDSVTLLQSWDKNLARNLPRGQRQQTALYYYPGSFSAKLLVGNKVVSHHDLLIRTRGWTAMVEQEPAPVYLDSVQVRRDGALTVTGGLVDSLDLPPSSLPRFCALYNTRDFGEIYSDNFSFEAAVQNTSSIACRMNFVILQCIDGVIWIPLCKKGCIADATLRFTSYFAPGNTHDLSAFGVDFNRPVRLKIVSKKDKAQVFIDGKTVYTIDHNIDRARIIGIGFRLQGSGSVDDIRLSNDRVQYIERF